MGTTDIDNRFQFHPASTEDKRKAHEYVREMLRSVAHKFDEALPEGREKAIVMTKLEEVMFWANAAIARNGD